MNIYWIILIEVIYIVLIIKIKLNYGFSFVLI